MKSSMRSAAITLLPLTIEKHAGKPLQQQIFDGIRLAVLEGRLAPGARLPSSRLLARELSVSRNTVLNAYEMLASEGYTEAKSGSVTRISSVLPETLQIPARKEDRQEKSAIVPPRLSRLAGINLRSKERTEDKIVPFHVSAPDLSEFPFPIWSRLLSRFWRNPPRELLINGNPAGYQPLRRAIADYLRSYRSVDCGEHQIIITTGAQQALTLASQVLLDPGDKVWLENPGYPGLHQAISATGAVVVPVDLDEEGIDIAKARETCPEARVTAVTPSHHYPMGVTMSLARRLALLEWAAESDGWIIEDDYDSEFRYAGRPLSALQGLDRQGRVIYAGTCSKVMFPGLKVGYLVVPEQTIDAFLRVRRAIDDHPAIAVQPALTAFLDEGHFASHVRRMRGLYAERREALVESLDHHFNGILHPLPSEAGMHVCATFDKTYEGPDDKTLVLEAREKGVNVTALSNFYLNEPAGQGLMLGFAGFKPSALKSASKKLAEILT